MRRLCCWVKSSRRHARRSCTRATTVRRAPRAARRCARLFRAQTPLYLRQGLFFGLEEARVGDFITRRERGNRLEAHGNPDRLSGGRQRGWLGTLTGETDVPLAGPAASDGGCLGRAFQGTMQDDLEQSRTVQPQTPRLRIQLAAHRNLRIGEALIASPAAKAWIAGRLASAYTAEDRLEGQITASCLLPPASCLLPPATFCTTCAWTRASGGRAALSIGNVAC